MNANPKSPRTARVRELFLEALSKIDPAERAAFLAAECRKEPELRERVEELLREQNSVGDFLEQPASAAPAGSGGPRPRTVSITAAMISPGEGPGDCIGNYKLLQQIGEGGCGSVYMAEQEKPVRRRVALKVIKAGMDTKSVIARFEVERQALALMDHPNIARVLDAGTTEMGRPYFVMELVRGIRITEYCDQNNLSTRDRLELFIKVCQAIQHAHQKGIIHRDIKPSNLLVTLHDGVPVPKVIDFGIAKATEQRLTDKTLFTAFEQFIGTPAYMSPEQAEMSGLDIDTRTDIYSLGVLLYEILTGKTPFDAKELAASGLDAMRRMIREQEPERPSTRVSTMVAAEATATAHHRQSEPSKLASLIRGDLDWIVMKAIEKDRTRRYATANELAVDIQRHLNNEPVVARPPSALYRCQKFVRRNRLPVAAAAAFAAALLLGLAVSTWQFLEKNKAYLQVVEGERMQRQLRETEVQLRRDAERQEWVARQRAYAADMNLAQHALSVNNLGRALELLNRHRPLGQTAQDKKQASSSQPTSPPPTPDARLLSPDLRGWEWRYLWQLCQSDALFSLCQQSNEVRSLAVSPDGKWVALGEAGDGGVSVWDLRARHEIVRLPAGETRGLHLAFAPNAPLLAFTSTERFATNAQYRVRFWDIATRRFLDDLPLRSGCRSLMFSEDGTRLLTATSDNQVTLWSLPERTGLRTNSLPQFAGRGGAFGNSVRVTQDFELGAYPLPEGKLRLVDLKLGQERWTVQAAEENVTAIAFSPDGKFLASGAGLVESSVRLWDVATGREVAHLEGHRGYVTSLLFWPDGQTLASGSGDQTINLWDVSGVRTVSTPPNPSRRREPRPGITHLRPTTTLRGHKLEVWSLALLPDTTTLVSGCKDGSVYVWDTSALRRERTRFTLPSPVRSWRFAPDGKSILATDMEGRVSRWQGTDFQDRQTLLETGGPLFWNAFSEDGRWLAAAVGFTNGVIRLWNLQTKTPHRELAAPQGRILGFLPQSNHLVTGRGASGFFQEWDPVSGQEVRSWQMELDLGFRPVVAFSRELASILVLGDKGEGRLRRLSNGQETILHLGLEDAQQVAFSPDGKVFAAVSILGTGGVWDSATAEKLASLGGFLQGMHAVTFSPDGQRLAVASNGSEAIKLWDVGGYQELITLEGRGSLFFSAAFSPDGNILASNNSRGELHCWRAPSLAEIQALESRPP